MDADKKGGDAQRILHFDVYRTIVLGHYIKFWGMPDYRTVIRKREGQNYFEIFSFPTTISGEPHRFATVGVAEQRKPDGENEGNEYFMALPSGLGGASVDEILEYITDLSTHLVVKMNRSLPPRVLGPSKLAPVAWGPKALLIDEARGESDDFQNVKVNDTLEVEILWMIPIHENEYRFILKEGIDAFDELDQRSDQSIADVNRSGIVP